MPALTGQLVTANRQTGFRAIQVRYIWYPIARLGLAGILALAVGVLLAGSVSALLIAALVATIQSSVGSRTQVEVSLAECLAYLGAGIVGVVAWCLLVFHWLARRRLNRPRNRKRRLAAVARRYPHRALEYAARWRPHQPRKLRGNVAGLPPGTVVIANGPRAFEHVRPSATDFAFEPIHILADEDRLQWLERSDAEAQGIIVDQPAGDDGSARRWMQMTWREWGVLFSGLVGLAWYSYLLYEMLTVGVTITSVFAIVILAVFVPALLIALYWKRSWWLVPGGLVHREICPFPRRLRLKLFTPPDYRLLVDMRQRFGIVSDGSESLAFHCANPWAVATAWLSSGRTPTLEELRGLLDPEGELKLEPESAAADGG